MEVDETSGLGDVARIAAEFEEFAYIVSHDLSAPIRQVNGFANLLIDSRKDSWEQDEKEIIEYLRRSLDRLDGMQGALLEFSRITTRGAAFDDVDSASVVDTVLNRFQSADPEYVISAERTDLPVVQADERQLQMLFEKLVDNALKFHEDDTAERRVSVSAREEDGFWHFEVADNGIGIQSNCIYIVFQMFHKLNQDRYPGIGAGLTIAKKIVERHNGRIWIESEIGKGMRVCFAIPK